MSYWHQPVGRMPQSVTLGLVAWLAWDRCFWAVREMRDGQPWCEAAGALGREAGADCGSRGDAAVVGSPVIDTYSPREGHNQVITHSSATHLGSAVAFCKDIGLRIWKHVQWACHDPTGS